MTLRKGKSKRNGVYSGIDEKRPKSETLLKKWMDEHGMSAYGVANELGKQRSEVLYWANGQRLPNLVDAFRVERLTAGRVPVASWLGTELGKSTWNNERTR